jgi:hypothetical protein
MVQYSGENIGTSPYEMIVLVQLPIAFLRVFYHSYIA